MFRVCAYAQPHAARHGRRRTCRAPALRTASSCRPPQRRRRRGHPPAPCSRARTHRTQRATLLRLPLSPLRRRAASRSRRKRPCHHLRPPFALTTRGGRPPGTLSTLMTPRECTETADLHATSRLVVVVFSWPSTSATRSAPAYERPVQQSAVNTLPRARRSGQASRKYAHPTVSSLLRGPTTAETAAPPPFASLSGPNPFNNPFADPFFTSSSHAASVSRTVVVEQAAAAEAGGNYYEMPVTSKGECALDVATTCLTRAAVIVVVVFQCPHRPPSTPSMAPRRALRMTAPAKQALMRQRSRKLQRPQRRRPHAPVAQLRRSTPQRVAADTRSTPPPSGEPPSRRCFHACACRWTTATVSWRAYSTHSAPLASFSRVRRHDRHQLATLLGHCDDGEGCSKRGGGRVRLHFMMP